MLRYSYVLLFLCILSDLLFLSDNSAIISDRKLKGLDMLNNALVYIIQKCDLGLKRIVIEDSSETLSTMTTLLAAEFPITFISQTKRTYNDEYYLKTPIIIDGFIIVLNTVGDIKVNLLIAINNVLTERSCIKNCTVIVLPNPRVECIRIHVILNEMRSNYISTTYVFCIAHEFYTVIFTADNYGDIEPSYWEMFQSIISSTNGITGAVYYRHFIEDEICRGFDFKRQNPKKYKDFQFGMIEYLNKNQLIAQKKVYYKGRYQDSPSRYIVDKVQNLQKLLNMEFNYFVVPVPYSFDPHRFIYEMIAGKVNVYFTEMVLYNNWRLMDISYPVSYDSCAILSHDRGLSSPLEKIAVFYGFWTLISLIIIVISTFVVIWLKTKKISAAAFDIVRLLINTEILVPINTLALKIFFFMIFIYFVVIHSTFSGNLAKFLTVPVSLDNINTLEDLRNSRVNKIYVLGCNIPELTYDNQLARKTIALDHSEKCMKNVEDDPNSVCVSTKISFMRKISRNDSSIKFHISKYTLPGMTNVIGYRKRFVLNDLFNWGIMVLSETRTLNYLREQAHRNITRKFLKYKSALEINFRPISLKNLRFAFIFWSVGITLSIFCFLIEICVHQKHNIKQKITNVRIFGNRKKIPELKVMKIYVQPKY